MPAVEMETGGRMPLEPNPLAISIQGVGASQRLERSLAVGVSTRVGRSPQDGWNIPWDRMISRDHANLLWDGTHLQVQLVDAARNPLIFHGKAERRLTLSPGEWFQIGQTTFQTRSLVPARVESPAESTAMFRVEEAVGFTEAELRKVRFQNASQQLELLSQLPEVIREAFSDDELCATLSRILMDALPQSQAVAVAHYDMAQLPTDLQSIESFPKPLTMRVEVRDEVKSRFHPSRKMIMQALKYQRSLVHISSGEGEGSGAFTLTEGLGWSFCCPVRGDATRGWCLYVSGRGTRTGSLIISEADLMPDLRFAELVAQFLGSIRQVRLLQEQKTQMSTFFSPKVIESLSDTNRSVDLLSPAERNVAILFCDVRGFSRKSEKLQGDLLKLLHSVSGALQVMAGTIQDHDGTIADFQGDAALGFWGWPVATQEGPLPACRAALQIYHEFCKGAMIPGGELEGFSVGFGIAYGRAVAGQIGTARQAKVGVFGPVVNQGSRLEGLSKYFGVPICVDEATAHYIRAGLGREVACLRRLARVRPKGMETSMMVYGLLPGSMEQQALSPELFELHEVAVDAVIQGAWEQAERILGQFPTTDLPSQQLLRLMAATHHKVPSEWDGSFTLTSK